MGRDAPARPRRERAVWLGESWIQIRDCLKRVEGVASVSESPDLKNGTCQIEIANASPRTPMKPRSTIHTTPPDDALMTWLDRSLRLTDSFSAVDGGVLASTWVTRQRRHAEDGSLASLIIEPNIKS